MISRTCLDVQLLSEGRGEVEFLQVTGTRLGDVHSSHLPRNPSFRNFFFLCGLLARFLGEILCKKKCKLDMELLVLMWK